ncbi:phosphatidylinositol transporter [Blastomyces gilchristii SLH14081]|uniref:Phosphatidylinositol transporter n=2 Tax=Blastomyces TaxID=229219 RepID=A0A179UA54_BLAGS|nr:phosphatidylinositol transporter [Blastomyces gilchristii SLH14081]EGE81555.1 phosphatidylinositol transporter [Blastomyces dermatitidis ATCC 18188]OAT04730.1 phosphatidylinositol transporter [Blastomyces gilchristii SLH14081]
MTMTLTRTPTNRSNRSRRSRRSSHSHPKSRPQSQEHPPVKKTESFEAAAAKASKGEATEGPDPLLGFLNHLSPQQSEALDAFKSILKEEQLYTEAHGETPASHDDSTLLRFLRARRFDVKGALDQFQSTEEWRKTNQIDALYQNFDIDSYEEARRVYPQWTGRRDRRGIPIYVFVIKNLNSKNMAAYSSGASTSKTSATHASSKVPARLLRLFALYENMIRFVLPLCSELERPHPETPIVNTTNIVDISGVGLKQFWNLKGHMQDASVLATAHYPETLDRIFIIGAPAFFPTVWGWIKRWFDPVTTSKIFILSASEVKSTLGTFMDPSNIPKQYGGELEWNWGDMPSLDEPAKKLASVLMRVGERGTNDVSAADLSVPVTGDTRTDFVNGPVAWNEETVEIMGSLDGVDRRRTLTISRAKHGRGTDASAGVSTAGSEALAEKEVVINGDGRGGVNMDAVTAGLAALEVDNEKVPEPASAAADKGSPIPTTA